MSRYALTPRAQADLEEIWDYTVGHWGNDQAEKYLRQLAEAMAYVAADLERGRISDDVRASYWNMQSASMCCFTEKRQGALMLSASCTNAWIFNAIFRS